MTVSDYLKKIEKFVERTPDARVCFRWSQEGECSRFLYIKSIRADGENVYLESQDPDEWGQVEGQVYFDGRVLVHLLSKVDTSLELKITDDYGGLQVYDFVCQYEDDIEYYEEDEEILCALPEVKPSWWEEDEEEEEDFDEEEEDEEK